MSCSPLPPSHLPRGDISQKGMRDLPTALPCGPGTERQGGPSPPRLSSTEYPRRCSPFLLGTLSPLCRSTVLCIGLQGTCGLQGLLFSPVIWVEGTLPHLGSHHLPSHPHLTLTPICLSPSSQFSLKKDSESSVTKSPCIIFLEVSRLSITSLSCQKGCSGLPGPPKGTTTQDPARGCSLELFPGVDERCPESRLLVLELGHFNSKNSCCFKVFTSSFNTRAGSVHVLKPVCRNGFIGRMFIFETSTILES